MARPVAGAPAQIPNRMRNCKHQLTGHSRPVDDLSIPFRLDPANYADSNRIAGWVGCNLCLNKIGLVTMDGDDGSSINDDARTYSHGQYRRAFVITLYEDSLHHLRVQLDCGGYFGDDSTNTACSGSLSAQLWIDYNDNGYDDDESRLMRRGWSANSAPNGAFDLDVQVPSIDDRSTRVGTHTMRVMIMPSHEYISRCGTVDYRETKEYTVNLIRRPRYIREYTLYSDTS